jgi:oligopeptide transport system permease protein
VLFTCLFVLPGDPVGAIGGGHAQEPAVRRALEHRYHLDRSLPYQYATYAAGVARGDLGESFRLRRPVSAVMRDKMGRTAELALAAIALEIVIGILAGTVAAVAHRSFVDVLVAVSTTLVFGIPLFVIGLLLQETFAVRIHLLPLAGTFGPRSLVLPALTLAAVDAALVARLVRAALLEALRSDYIRTAVAKGLTRRRVLVRHALRNSLIPVVTYLGIAFGTLLGGALVVEVVFSWDGVGNALVTAIAARDNPVVLGIATYAVVAFALVSLAVDVAYVYLDPRTRLQ